MAKNKVAAPFRRAEFDIIYNRGIDRMAELVELGVAFKIIDKAGAWFSYGDLRIGQGKEKSSAYLRENPKLAAEIEAKVVEATNAPSGSA